MSSTPGAVEAVGGDEFLYEDGVARNGAYIAPALPRDTIARLRRRRLDDGHGRGERLADRYAGGITQEAMLDPASRFWQHAIRGLTLDKARANAVAHAAILPWLAHDAIVHLSVPHGLEQYTGAALGYARCRQGPVEFLLTYEHYREAGEVVKTVFSEQYSGKGDWPQWFVRNPIPTSAPATATVISSSGR